MALIFLSLAKPFANVFFYSLISNLSTKSADNFVIIIAFSFIFYEI